MGVTVTAYSVWEMSPARSREVTSSTTTTWLRHSETVDSCYSFDSTQEEHLLEGLLKELEKEQSC